MIDQADIHKINTYRGKPWAIVFKRIDESEHIESLRQSLLVIKATGKLTLRDLAQAYINYKLDGIAGKTFFRFVEGPIIPYGTYDDFVGRGGNWSQIVNDVKAERVSE